MYDCLQLGQRAWPAKSWARLKVRCARATEARAHCLQMFGLRHANLSGTQAASVSPQGGACWRHGPSMRGFYFGSLIAAFFSFYALPLASYTSTWAVSGSERNAHPCPEGFLSPHYVLKQDLSETSCTWKSADLAGSHFCFWVQIQLLHCSLLTCARFQIALVTHARSRSTKTEQWSHCRH